MKKLKLLILGLFLSVAAVSNNSHININYMDNTRVEYSINYIKNINPPYSESDFVSSIMYLSMLSSTWSQTNTDKWPAIFAALTWDFTQTYSSGAEAMVALNNIYNSENGSSDPYFTWAVNVQGWFVDPNTNYPQ